MIFFFFREITSVLAENRTQIIQMFQTGEFLGNNEMFSFVARAGLN